MGAPEVLNVAADGGSLSGWIQGTGPPVLLLHGGPGLNHTYLDDLGAELAAEFRVASYQQRGLVPSTLEGPFTVAQSIEDAIAVLDGLQWPRAWVVGHSWGGHLALRLAADRPERLLGALAVEPIGVVGDGGHAAFEAEMSARTSLERRRRAEELDERELSGEGTDAEFREAMEIWWPAYFADPEQVPPMPPMRTSVPAYAGISAEMLDGLDLVAAQLADGHCLYAVLAGAASPIPWGQAARATVELSPRASLTVVGAAGHFPWVEQPGCVLASLRRLSMQAAREPGHQLVAGESPAV
ncbi:MAG TPA: alpha/beta hydrolase [Solirubrobacteraceae bacterium]|jgi:pimeloyl-ACP methyl ester carboxylesterase